MEKKTNGGAKKLLLIDKYAMIALRMMTIEMNGPRPNHKSIYNVGEWYYSLFKREEYRNTSFNNKKTRDPHAAKHADSFRKTFSKQLRAKVFTVEFLTKVVLGLRFFGPFSSWDEYTTFIDATYDLFVEAHETVYGKICEQWEILEATLPRDNFFNWFYAEYFWEMLILTDRVTFTYGGNETREVAAESYHRTVFWAKSDVELNKLEIYDHSIASVPRAIEFDKKMIFKKNPNLFYYTVGGALPWLVLDAISIIPLNAFGHWQLKYGKLFFKRITNEMICSAENAESIGCIYLECCTGVLGLGVLSEFSHYIQTLITRIVGPTRVHDVPIYIADDSRQKQEIIVRYDFEKTDIELEINSCFRYTEDGEDRLWLKRVKYSLYEVSLYKMYWMKYTIGETDYSFD